MKRRDWIVKKLQDILVLIDGAEDMTEYGRAMSYEIIENAIEVIEDDIALLEGDDTDFENGPEEDEE